MACKGILNQRHQCMQHFSKRSDHGPKGLDQITTLRLASGAKARAVAAATESIQRQSLGKRVRHHVSGGDVVEHQLSASYT
eukprot:42311-Chlamydomonas_euryale.AAC.1